MVHPGSLLLPIAIFRADTDCFLFDAGNKLYIYIFVSYTIYMNILI
jgi:hypothetical protein